MAGRGKNRDDRAAQERARAYAARLEYQAGLVRRRTRDNLIAAVGGGVLLLAILGGQVAYFTAGPGAPAPVPAPTPTSTSTPAESPAPTESPASPENSPEPTPTSAPTP